MSCTAATAACPSARPESLAGTSRCSKTRRPAPFETLGQCHVLEVYRRAYDPLRPVVCLDEQPMPLPTQHELPERYDHEYERVGTATNFMLVEPLAGWRKVSVRATKTDLDLTERSMPCWISTIPTPRRSS